MKGAVNKATIDTLDRALADVAALRALAGRLYSMNNEADTAIADEISSAAASLAGKLSAAKRAIEVYEAS